MPVKGKQLGAVHAGNAVRTLKRRVGSTHAESIMQAAKAKMLAYHLARISRHLSCMLVQ